MSGLGREPGARSTVLLRNKIPKTRKEIHLRGGTTTMFHTPKILTHERSIVFGQGANQFAIEVIATGSRSTAVTLIVGRFAFFDVFPQAVVQVFVGYVLLRPYLDYRA